MRKLLFDRLIFASVTLVLHDKGKRKKRLNKDGYLAANEPSLNSTYTTPSLAHSYSLNIELDPAISGHFTQITTMSYSHRKDGMRETETPAFRHDRFRQLRRATSHSLCGQTS